jgi:hypothetical protein
VQNSQKPCVNSQFLFLAVAVDYGEITANTEVKGESKVKTILKNPQGNESLAVMLLKSLELCQKTLYIILHLKDLRYLKKRPNYGLRGLSPVIMSHSVCKTRFFKARDVKVQIF